MTNAENKFPFTKEAIGSLQNEVAKGKHIFTSGELKNIGIDNKDLEIESYVAGRTRPYYLKKHYNSDFCDANLGDLKLITLSLVLENEQYKLPKYLVFKCPEHLFLLINLVRNQRREIKFHEGEAWALTHDSEMYRHKPDADERAKRLKKQAELLRKEHSDTLQALQILMAHCPEVNVEIMEVLSKETGTEPIA